MHAAPSCGIHVYPNPFTDQVLFSTLHRQHTIQSIEIFDILGDRIILQDHIDSPVFIFKRSSLMSGVYIVKVKAERTFYIRLIAK